MPRDADLVRFNPAFGTRFVVTVDTEEEFDWLKPIEREALYWEHEGNRAVRQGDWKLVAKHQGDWELYNIAKDRVESNNLAAKHPDKIKELAAMYAVWAKRSQVEPWPLAKKESD